MLTFEKFSISPMKIRVLFTKIILNNIQNASLDENYLEDKRYKKALKLFQIYNNLGENCMLTRGTFDALISNFPTYNELWNDLKKMR